MSIQLIIVLCIGGSAFLWFLYKIGALGVVAELIATIIESVSDIDL